MKRFRVHVAVHDLQQSIRFYSALFAAEPGRNAIFGRGNGARRRSSSVG